MSTRRAWLFGDAPPEPVVLAPGRRCDRCGRAEVLDGGWLCLDCTWMAAEEDRR